MAEQENNSEQEQQDAAFRTKVLKAGESGYVARSDGSVDKPGTWMVQSVKDDRVTLMDAEGQTKHPNVEVYVAFQKNQEALHSDEELLPSGIESSGSLADVINSGIESPPQSSEVQELLKDETAEGMARVALDASGIEPPTSQELSLKEQINVGVPSIDIEQVPTDPEGEEDQTAEEVDSSDAKKELVEALNSRAEDYNERIRELQKVADESLTALNSTGRNADEIIDVAMRAVQELYYSDGATGNLNVLAQSAADLEQITSTRASVIDGLENAVRPALAAAKEAVETIKQLAGSAKERAEEEESLRSTADDVSEAYELIDRKAAELDEITPAIANLRAEHDDQVRLLTGSGQLSEMVSWLQQARRQPDEGDLIQVRHRLEAILYMMDTQRPQMAILRDAVDYAKANI